MSGIGSLPLFASLRAPIKSDVTLIKPPGYYPYPDQLTQRLAMSIFVRSSSDHRGSCPEREGRDDRRSRVLHRTFISVIRGLRIRSPDGCKPIAPRAQRGRGSGLSLNYVTRNILTFSPPDHPSVSTTLSLAYFFTLVLQSPEPSSSRSLAMSASASHHRRSISASATSSTHPPNPTSPFGDSSSSSNNSTGSRVSGDDTVIHFQPQRRISIEHDRPWDDEISPRTAPSASIQSQVVPDNILANDPFQSPDMSSSANGNGSGSKRDSSSKNGMTPSNSQFFNENYSPATPTAEEGSVMPEVVSPPRSSGEYSPTQEFRTLSNNANPAGFADQPSPNEDGLQPGRPGLGRLNSDQPLLHDVSGANTPMDGNLLNPFDNVKNGDGSLSPVSPHSSGRTSPDLEAIGPNAVAPKIHINSIPNSPDANHVASFDARPSFAAPFSDHPSAMHPTSFAGKKVSIAENPVDMGGRRYSDNPALEHARSANIAARRSQRMKTQQERLSTISGKGKGTWGAGAGQDKSGGGKTGPGTNRKPFQSTRLKGEIYKPWLEKKDPAQRWARWITIVSIIIGIGAAAACTSIPT